VTGNRVICVVFEHCDWMSVFLYVLIGSEGKPFESLGTVFEHCDFDWFRGEAI
jgi:hypothetical protein